MVFNRRKSPAGGRAWKNYINKSNNSISFQEVNALALSVKLPLSWYPNGKQYGLSLRIGNLAGDKGQSLWICLRTGAWKDHATGEGGGDLVSLYAAMKGIRQVEALQELSSIKPQVMPCQPSVIAKTNTKQDDEAKISYALGIWSQGQNMERTPAANYLNSRNLTYTSDMPLKYHPACPKEQEHYPAMLALITDAGTNKLCGVHRTFIKPDGTSKAAIKPNKMMLGRARNGVIRLTPDENVTSSLGIVEGIENGLAILGMGWTPVWVALSSGGIANFPVLEGIEFLTIFADHDKTGQDAAQKCAQRWTEVGREVTIRTPSIHGTDWNDAILEVV